MELKGFKFWWVYFLFIQSEPNDEYDLEVPVPGGLEPHQDTVPCAQCVTLHSRACAVQQITWNRVQELKPECSLFSGGPYKSIY